MMVVVYHVFVGRVSGGVDIFLLISAFFMTLSFVRKIESDRPIAIGRYWLHTFKRLLPMAVVTILATSLLLGLLYPEWAIWEFRPQALSSAFYFENWHLAATNVDYYARDGGLASPFQHFWSLSIQGQVFLVWPLVFGLAWWLRRRFGIGSVRTLTIAFATIFAASLTYSIITTNTRQEFAYFDTGARLWEFALGSLFALAIPYLQPGKAVRVVLGWVGFIAMLAVGIVVDVQTAFPGWIALWPLLAAGAIITAGQSGSVLGVDRFLAWRPIVKLGDSAYALYLVHWPILITYLVVSDQQVADPAAGAVLVVASTALAIVLTRLIEQPLKNWAWPEASKRRLALVVAICLVGVSVPVGGWMTYDVNRLNRLVAESRGDGYRNHPGALSLLPGFWFEGDPDAPVLPRVGNLRDQWVELPERCSGPLRADEGAAATYCRQTPTLDEPTRTVAVVGNSHAQQLMGTIIPIAEEQDWQLISLVQPICSFGLGGQPEECLESNESFVRYLEQLQPDVVFTVSTWGAVVVGVDERLVTGQSQAIDRLVAAGIRVVGIRDNPRLGFNPVDCLGRPSGDGETCSVAQEVVLGPVNPAEVWEGREGYVNLDFTDLICPDGICPPVIGNVLVWLDGDHLTSDYATTIAFAAHDRILAAAGE